MFLLIFYFFCRKQRFYLYTRRLPSDLQDVDRDVFNEKPSKEDIIAVPEGQGIYNLTDNFVLQNYLNLFKNDKRKKKTKKICFYLFSFIYFFLKIFFIANNTIPQKRGG